MSATCTVSSPAPSLMLLLLRRRSSIKKKARESGGTSAHPSWKLEKLGRSGDGEGSSRGSTPARELIKKQNTGCNRTPVVHETSVTLVAAAVRIQASGCTVRANSGVRTTAGNDDTLTAQRRFNALFQNLRGGSVTSRTQICFTAHCGPKRAGRTKAKHTSLKSLSDSIATRTWSSFKRSPHEAHEKEPQATTFLRSSPPWQVFSTQPQS